MDEKWICFSNRMDEGTLSKGSMIRFDGHWDYNCTYVKMQNRLQNDPSKDKIS